MDDAKRPQSHALENMSIPELESLLLQHFMATISEETLSDSDTEYMHRITEVIMQKEEAAGIAKPVDVDRAWREFQEFYMGWEIEDEDEEDPPGEEAAEALETPPVEAAAPAALPAGRARRTVRRTVLVAALVIALIAMAAIPVAGHRSLFEMIATWTEEQFTFQSKEADSEGFLKSNTDKANGYSTIEEALSAYGIKRTLLPTTLPEGFVQTKLKVSETEEEGARLYAQYSCDDLFIAYTIVLSKKPTSNTYEKNGIEVEPYQTGNGLSFYLFTNEGDETAVCHYDTIEISILTNASRSELKQMLDTIS